jgi:hypothetical protein
MGALSRRETSISRYQDQMDRGSISAAARRARAAAKVAGELDALAKSRISVMSEAELLAKHRELDR